MRTVLPSEIGVHRALMAKVLRTSKPLGYLIFWKRSGKI